MCQKVRCRWCGNDPLYQRYHDEEWGVPLKNEQKLFEFLTLEGAQAGLSWITILKKREGYRQAFDNFNVQKIARYSDAKINKLLENPNIVRNRLKIESTRNNAKRFIEIQKQYGSFGHYLWGFVDHKAIQNQWQTQDDIPAKTPLSEMISKDMKKQGFKFVGATIIYALMQAIGMVNDHTINCFRHNACKKLSQ